MTQRWCVCGLVPHDSGKTWLSLGLALALKARGIRVKLVKPVAGHSAWHQPETIRLSKELGLLVGSDVGKYMEELGLRPSDVPFANPVDLLLAPPSAVSAIKSRRLRQYVATLEVSVGQIALARLPSERLEPRHYVITDVVERLPRSLESLVRDLAHALSAEEIELSEFVRLLRSRAIEDRVLRCLDAFTQGASIVIIESFNDALAPLPTLVRSIDAFILAGLGVVAVYRDVDRVRKALEAELALRGEEALRASYVLNHVEPTLVIEIDFVSNVRELARSPSINRLLDYLLAPRQGVREPR